MIKRMLRQAALPAALLAATSLGGCYYPYGYYGYYGYPAGYYGGYYGYGYPAYVGTGVVVGGWGYRCCGYGWGWHGGYGWGWHGSYGYGWHGGWHGSYGGWHGSYGGGWHH